MKTLNEQYNELEERVFNELKTLIENSGYTSKHIDENAIEVSVFDYTELTVVNNKLTFLDSDGLHYSIYADANLEDLIDIINSY